MRARKVFAPVYKDTHSSILNDSDISGVALPDITFHEFTTDYIIPEPQKPLKIQAKSNSPFSKPYDISPFRHQPPKIRPIKPILPNIHSRAANEPKLADYPNAVKQYRDIVPENSPEKSFHQVQTPPKSFINMHQVAKIYGLVPSSKKTSVSNTASPMKPQDLNSSDFKAKRRKYSGNSSILHGQPARLDHETSIDSFFSYVITSNHRPNVNSEFFDDDKGNADLDDSNPSANLSLQIQALRNANKRGYEVVRSEKKRNDSAYINQQKRLKTLLRAGQQDDSFEGYDIQPIQPRKTAQFSLPPLRLKSLRDHETNDISNSSLDRNSSLTQTDHASQAKILLRGESSKGNISYQKERTEETQRTARFMQPTSSRRKRTGMEKKASVRTIGQSTSRSRKETYREHIMEGYRDRNKKLLYTHDRIGFQIEDQVKVGIKRPRVPRQIKNTIKINTELQNVHDKPSVEVVECDPNYDVKSDLVDTMIDDDTWKFFTLKHKEYTNADYIKTKETYADLIKMDISKDLDDVETEFSKYLVINGIIGIY